MRELSPLEISKWYAIAVGEIGISPTDFYEMTEEEMEWAHQGYKQKQQDLANLILLAINRKNNKLFEFIKKDYDIGSLADRKNTFLNLGINEEEV